MKRLNFRMVVWLLLYFGLGVNYSNAQCNWQTLPNGENVDGIARPKEDRNVLRSEVFNLSDGSVYAAYWFDDQTISVVPFSGGVWQLGNSFTLDQPFGTVGILKGWAIGKIGTDNVFVAFNETGGFFTKNLTTNTNWGSGFILSLAGVVNTIKDVAFHPTSGEVHILRQPNTTTLAWSKLNTTTSVYTDLGTIKDVTTNTVTYPGNSTANTTTVNTVSTRYMPQLKFYGTGDVLVTYGLQNSLTEFNSGFFPRAMRFNSGTSSWGQVTVEYNGGTRESFVNELTSNPYYIESRVNDFALSDGPGRPYFSMRPETNFTVYSLYVMNTSTNEAHNISNSNLQGKSAIHTYSDSNNDFYGAYTDYTNTSFYKRDNSSGTVTTVHSMPTILTNSGEAKGILLFGSGSSLFGLEGSRYRNGFFGDYNHQTPHSAIYKTRSLNAPFSVSEPNFWMNDISYASTYSKLFNGANNDLILAYADTLFTDSTYRIAFKKWDGSNWVSAGLTSFGSSTDAVEDFDVLYDGTYYYLAQVKPGGDCELLRWTSFSSSWGVVGTPSAASTYGATRFVRLSTSGTFSTTLNILTASKLGAVNKLKYAQWTGSTMYPGQALDLNAQFVANKYLMQAVVVNANKTLLLYRSQTGGAVKYLNGSSYLDWSTAFNTDFAVAGWQSFDAQYDQAGGELLVAYNTGSANSSFKRAKVDAATGNFNQTTTNGFTQLGAIPAGTYNTNVFGQRIAFTYAANKVYVLTTNNLGTNGSKMAMLEGDKSAGTWTSGINVSSGISRNQDILNSPLYGMVAKWGGHNLHVLNLPSAPAAPANTTANLTACSGQTKILTVTSAGATVNWFTTPTGGTSIGTGNSFTTPILSGSITYYAEASNGCGTSTTRTAIALTIGTSPTVTASASSTTVCSGASVTFTGGGADTYSWNNGVSNGTPTNVTVGGNYTVTGTAANGCTGTANVAITVNNGPAMSASLSTNDTLCQGSVFSINVAGSGFVSPSISNNLNATTYTFTNATNLVAQNSVEYYLSAAGANGCISYDTLDLVVTITPAPSTPTTTAYVPLTLTGFNQDIVANGTNVFTSTTTSVDSDADGCRFIALDYTQYGTPTRYLPTGGSFTSQVASTPNLPFQLANYVGNNSLTLQTGAMTGTLSLATPTAMTGFYLLGTGGGGLSVVDITLNFSDGTTQTVSSYTISDWFNGADAAIAGTGRYYAGALGFQGPSDTNPRLYQFLIDVAAANESKLVSSVSFSRQNIGSMKAQLMGITAITEVSNQSFCASDFPTVSDLTATGTNVQWYAAPTGGSPLAPTAALSTGTYYATQTLNGCETFNRAAKNVTVNASPTRTVTGSFCDEYEFNGTYYTQSGTYYETVTNPSGPCDSIITLNLTITTTPVVTFNTSSPLSVCQGDTVQLNATGGTTVTWTGGIQNNVPFVATSSQNLVVTVSTNGCPSDESFTLSVTPVPTATLATTNTSCTANTGSVTLSNVSGGSAPYLYSWSNGAQTQNLSNVGVGIYTVTIENSAGCTNDLSISVNADNAPALTVNGTTDLNCFGDLTGSVDLTATGGNGTLNFDWDDANNSSTEDLSNVGAGTYTVVVTDASNCSSSIAFTINEPTALGEIATSSNVSCGGATDGSVDVTVTGGVSPYTYAWSNSATSEDLVNLNGGTYSVTVTDANGCVLVSSDYDVLENAPISITGTTTEANCGQTDGAIDLTVVGGTNSGTIAWSNGATSEDLTGLAAGSYTVTFTDDNGCSATAPFNVNSIGGPVITGTQTDATCASAADGAIDITVSGTGPFTYSWDNGSTSEDQTGLTPGTYIVTVNGSQANCPSFDTYIIEGPVYVATATQNGSTITADVAGANYQWIDCATGAEIVGETNQSFTATVNGSYAVIVSDGQCSDTTACITINNAGVVETDHLAINVYPNPSNGSFYMESPEPVSYTVIDLFGKIVLKDASEAGVTTLDLSAEASGV